MGLYLFIGYLLVVNGMAFVAFGDDKRRAEQDDWRIPEMRLLGVALLGGWAGAKLGQRIFRHKTRKQPFAAMLNFTVAVWIGSAGIALAMAATKSPTGLNLTGGFSLFLSHEDPAPQRSTPRFFTRVSN